MAEKDLLEQEEVLDFDDDTLPELPDDNPFDSGASKRPWILAGIGLVAVTLVVVVVLKLTTGGKDSGLIELPIEQVVTEDVPTNDFVEDAKKLVAVDADADKPVGMPERIVDNRKDVTFDPDKPVVQKPRPRPIDRPAKPVASKPSGTAQKPVAGGFAVQVGSYATRTAAESGQRKLQAAHRSLFEGHNFVILSAVLPNGQTTYRLRVVGFGDSHSASGFCRNAQSDGVSCYVTK
ncbi:MAG: SPOR domain-containing protein [Rickettsiales bacterium]|jgi:cell division protein FtsN|nr:SPOR domain-containing protein [Rickettsiales bacterium]